MKRSGKFLFGIILILSFLALDVRAQFVPYTFYGALSFGGSLNDAAEYVGMVEGQDIITFGQFRNNVNFNPQGAVVNLSALGNPDIFLSRHEQDGALSWAINLGRIGLTDGMNSGGLVVCQDGSVVITGAFSSVVNFNPLGTNTSLTAVAGKDAFVAKYNSSGILQWLKRFGDTAFESGTAVTCDNDMNIYVAVSFADEIDADPGTAEVLLQSAGGTDAALIKLSPNGDYLWHRHISTAGNDQISALLSYESQWTGLAGCINGTSEAIPQVELFGSVMTQAGADIWTINYNNLSPGNRMHKVAISEDGRIYFGGEIQTTTDFDPGNGEAIINPLFKDVFAASYLIEQPLNNAFRAVVSPRGAGIAENLAFLHIENGNLCIGGSFDVDIQFEEGNNESYFTSAGQRDIYTAVYTLNGDNPVYAGANTFGGVGDEFAADGVIQDFFLALGGSFVPTLDIDPQGSPILTAGGRDAYWAKILWPYNLSATGSRGDEYSISLYPVPTNDMIRFNIYTAWNGAIRVRLISALGKVLDEYEFISITQELSIPVSTLGQGMYFLEFEINGRRITKRFVKI